MLAIIIFVESLFEFPVTLNSFKRFPSRTNFIFATVSYRLSSSYCCCYLAAAGTCCCFSTMSFNLSFCPYPIFSIILLYNKEVISRTLCSLSASASRVAVTGADTALYNFEIVFLKNVLSFY